MMISHTESKSTPQVSPGLGKPSVKIRIKPVHTCVPGRARYHVNILHRASALGQQLEQQMGAISGIMAIRVNGLTGSVVIVYGKDIALDELPYLLLEACKQAIKGLRFTGSLTKTDTKALIHFKAYFDSLWRHTQNLFASTRGISVSPRAPQDNTDWHVLEVNHILEKLQVDAHQGMNKHAVQRTLEKYGLNQLPEIARRSPLSMFLSQLFTLPVGLLGASALVSLATGGILDAGIIVGVVLINASIGFFTEMQAERIISSLTKITPRHAQVIRDGELQSIPHAHVAVGDVLVLQPGDFIAADARVIKASQLTLDESALTGESMPVSKNTSPIDRQDTPLADRRNMVYMGTMITGGNGLGIVIATGVNTQIGQIQSLVGEAHAPETPMQQELDHIGTQLALTSGAICVGVFGLGMLRGYGLLQMLKSSVSLAVAAVPEGLPAVATTTLALGIRKMSKYNVAVRHLDAVETLGSVQVFCLDKTGTLTLNCMTAVTAYVGGKHYFVSGEQLFVENKPFAGFSDDSYRRFLEIISLCNEAVQQNSKQQISMNGTPTENALLELARLSDLDIDALRQRYPHYKIKYRAENRPYMYTFHRLPRKRHLIAVKGSPQEVLMLCDSYQDQDGIHPIDDAFRVAMSNINNQMAGDALRVLAVAYAERPIRPIKDEEAPVNLIWLGLVGMTDPLRTGMPDLMRLFHRAGIHTVMITGDQSSTAYAIGKQLNLSNGKPLQILDSTRLEKLDQKILSGLIHNVHVFARVSPANKLQIVQAIQKSGKIVAMTGDGINDGPALKAANIGVAMGGASSDVARSVSDVVLEDDNLHTMVAAVEHGRAIYNNIRKSIHYLISTNMSEIEVMLAGIAMGAGEVLSPKQLLWINLVTDIFPGLALSMEAPAADLIRQPPRDPQEKIIRRQDLIRMARESTIITTGSMAAYGYGFLRYGIGPQSNTILFNSLTLAQLLHSITCRSESHSIFSRGTLPRNPYLNYAIAGSGLLQVMAMLIPGLRSGLGSSPLNVLDLLVVAGGAVAPMLINDSFKHILQPEIHSPHDQSDTCTSTTNVSQTNKETAA
ncbi:cation-translocating P-type ATPase [Nitrosomonas communis]|uniref:Ca2+-transporting ATPase n=1 Tax=Nitrosomonas communis TaxID=44574 RepID=A0A1I4L9I4_9PROT|nr:HAD-IC family P-type ATPase [Nitrosomonas communis]SFL87698.1 Ca2+-transporting ATPase [Nitrosomonas communis]